MEVDGEEAIASAVNTCEWEGCATDNKTSLVGTAGGSLSATKWAGHYLCKPHMIAAGREQKEANVCATKTT